MNKNIEAPNGKKRMSFYKIYIYKKKKKKNSRRINKNKNIVITICNEYKIIISVIIYLLKNFIVRYFMGVKDDGGLFNRSSLNLRR